MRDVILKVREILPPQQRRQALGLFAMTTLVALLETAGVVSIIPFMMVVANPKVLHGGGWLSRIYDASGIESENHFLFLLGVGVFLVLVVGNAAKAFTTWKTQKFTQFAGHVVSERLIRAYLAQPYDYFLTRHSSDLGKNVLIEVNQVITGLVQPGMTAISRGIITLFLSALLIITDPLLAITVVAMLGGAYALLYHIIRGYLARIGQDRLTANRERYHVTSEAFAAVKEIKLRGLETAYSRRYSGPSLRYAQRQSATQSLSELPRYGLEVIAFGGILTIVLYLLTAQQGLEGALPLIALYALAGYRMLPNVQEVFAGMAKVRVTRPALDLLYRDLKEKTAQISKSRPALSTPLPFERNIRLDRVSYQYPAGSKPVIREISLEIPRGARVGFIGPTGSGKSTIMDMILGLLQPKAGTVLIDGRALDSEALVRGWQSRIGYVPQHIFLADDTVAANIAFGQPDGTVDLALVERAARMAQLHDFIVNELAQGYDTPVGERGIRLSGGQRQRLGLARALYGDPAVLVLDEATSALDTETEDAVMQALDGLSNDCTVIMIAHRLSTVRQCDVLFKVKAGRIVATGSYEQVVTLAGGESDHTPAG